MLSNYPKFKYLIIVISISVLTLTACGGSTSSSPQDEMITIGVINQYSFLEPILDGFKAQMEASGFVEGEDIIYIYNEPTNFDVDVIQQEIQTLLAQDIDLFFTIGSIPTGAVNAILEENDLYGVFAAVTNPERQNLVDTLTVPGGRMTGINVGGPIIRKSLEWLLTVAPNQNVHVFYGENDILALGQIEDLQITSDELNVELVLHEITDLEDAVRIVEGMSADQDVIYSIATQLDASAIVPVAFENNIVIGASAIIANVFVTGPRYDYQGVGSQSAFLAQQVISGADPGILPVEPAQYSLLLNLELGESMGLNIPDSIIQQAAEVVSFPPPEVLPEATAEATSEAGDA